LTACLPDWQTPILQDAENNWQFDIFAFAEATPGTTLSVLTFHLYKQASLISHFQMDERKLCKFLQKVESGYSAENPYHNRCRRVKHGLCSSA